MSDELYISVINDTASAALNTLALKSNAMVSDVLEQAGEMVRNRAVKNINTGIRTGAEYTRGGKKGYRSKPWDFPKSDTSELVKSITVSSDISGKGLSVTVGSRASAPHGYWLEFGTTKMLPRPWLGRSYHQEKDNINRFIDYAVDKMLNEL